MAVIEIEVVGSIFSAEAEAALNAVGLHQELAVFIADLHCGFFGNIDTPGSEDVCTSLADQVAICALDVEVALILCGLHGEDGFLGSNFDAGIGNGNRHSVQIDTIGRLCADGIAVSSNKDVVLAGFQCIHGCCGSIDIMGIGQGLTEGIGKGCGLAVAGDLNGIGCEAVETACGSSSISDGLIQSDFHGGSVNGVCLEDCVCGFPGHGCAVNLSGSILAGDRLRNICDHNVVVCIFCHAHIIQTHVALCGIVGAGNRVAVGAGIHNVAIHIHIGQAIFVNVPVAVDGQIVGGCLHLIAAATVVHVQHVGGGDAVVAPCVLHKAGITPQEIAVNVLCGNKGVKCIGHRSQLAVCNNNVIQSGLVALASCAFLIFKPVSHGNSDGIIIGSQHIGMTFLNFGGSRHRLIQSRYSLVKGQFQNGGGVVLYGNFGSTDGICFFAHGSFVPGVDAGDLLVCQILGEGVAILGLQGCSCGISSCKVISFTLGKLLAVQRPLYAFHGETLGIDGGFGIGLFAYLGTIQKDLGSVDDSIIAIVQCSTFYLGRHIGVTGNQRFVLSIQRVGPCSVVSHLGIQADKAEAYGTVFIHLYQNAVGFINAGAQTAHAQIGEVYLHGVILFGTVLHNFTGEADGAVVGVGLGVVVAPGEDDLRILVQHIQQFLRACVKGVTHGVEVMNGEVRHDENGLVVLQACQISCQSVNVFLGEGLVFCHAEAVEMIQTVSVDGSLANAGHTGGSLEGFVVCVAFMVALGVNGNSIGEIILNGMLQDGHGVRGECAVGKVAAEGKQADIGILVAAVFLCQGVGILHQILGQIGVTVAVRGKEHIAAGGFDLTVGIYAGCGDISLPIFLQRVLFPPEFLIVGGIGGDHEAQNQSHDQQQCCQSSARCFHLTSPFMLGILYSLIIVFRCEFVQYILDCACIISKLWRFGEVSQNFAEYL